MLLRRLGSALLAAGVLIAALSTPVAADEVVQMANTGPSSNRLDLVILGDGYKASQFKIFAKDAETFREAFFSKEPFASYRNYFNVVRVETPSKVSGAGFGSSKGTAFGAYFNCFQVERLLCVDEGKVAAKLAGLTASNARDLVIVLVNDKRYGGSGGPYAVASTHEYSGDVAIHEFGHSFGHLDDEYVDDFNCGRYTDPWGFNVTEETARPDIPWTHWIANTTPLPTPEQNTNPGLFEGAFFCAEDWYRPTAYSMMRSLGAPFGPVNGEQLIRRAYEFVTVLDQTSPKKSSIQIPRDGFRRFSATAIDPTLPSLRIVWRLDGRKIGTGPDLKLLHAALAGKSRTLSVTVIDATKSVRKAPTGALVDTRSWTVKPG